MSAHDHNEKHHTSLKDKIKGAAHIVHGMGEDIRGSVMGAVEAVSGSEEAKARDQDIVSKGRSEIEQGIAQMKGATAPDAASTTAVESQVGTRTDDELQAQQQPAREVSGAEQAPTQISVGTETEPENGGQEQAAQTDPAKGAEQPGTVF